MAMNTALPFEILPTDVFFTDSPFDGEPQCFCSRCLQVIGEDDGSIRFWTQDGEKEWRYHPGCLGFKPVHPLATELTHKKELN